MKLTIFIPDDSDECLELLDCVKKTNETSNQNMTSEQYVTNLVIGYFKNRVLNVYKGFAGKQSINVLKEKFGGFENLRDK